ncbi:hypothetical protein [Mycoplasma bradburyae]|uniref:Haemagglutinin Mycoplasma domain-containing protein n=1 Tax=Mycoplasma bradburyae TaxID=2963128 RepID=A0ABT5GAH0_9MOLU|nr:hypothetical protein [Mycoplasma bradburyae]MDC4181769.1 hypothetical protein [Mycoplasma bradburyae]UTS69807.1 hypothetical protein NMG68_02155 [Mycoplasma bradburyae]
MKQKTKKLLQLSFSLGFLATTALIATSCNQPKTVTPKPTNPMQPGNGSGSGSGETMQPGSGSGTGTGTTTPDNSEAKNQLKALIDKENDNLGLYEDYSMIKSTLAEAYDAAKEINNKANATPQELTDAKSKLDAAINKAKTDKTTFDSENVDLVNAYSALKNKLSSKDSDLEMISEDKYLPIKTHLTNLYDQASNFIKNTLQANPKPTDSVLNNLKTNIESVVSRLSDEKNNLDQYSNFKLFKIEDSNFKGDLKYSRKPENAQNLVGFSSSFDNDVDSYQWKYATRYINNIDNENKNSEVTNVGWIYNLDSNPETGKKPASYEVTFEYYGGPTATLYFPYKAAKEGQNKDTLSLKYKLNDKAEMNFDLSNVKVDGIEVAKIELTDLKFGENKISFSTANDKKAPMIGNIYISSTSDTTNAVYDDIFGNIKNSNKPNEITVDFAKGYGLANKGFGLTGSKHNTFIKKLTGKLGSASENKDYYLLGYLGNNAGGMQSDASNNELYYSFYVNAPKEGEYDISGIYNLGTNNRGLRFWTKTFGNTESGSSASFNTPKHGEWSENLLAIFDKNNKAADNKVSLNLKKGLNKIIVSGSSWNSEAPNLGNVTFTFKNTPSPSTSSTTPTTDVRSEW